MEAEVAGLPPEATDPLQVPKDLFSGACGGIAQVLIGASTPG